MSLALSQVRVDSLLGASCPGCEVRVDQGESPGCELTCYQNKGIYSVAALLLTLLDFLIILYKLYIEAVGCQMRNSFSFAIKH